TWFTQPENYTGDFILARKIGTPPKPTIDHIGTDFELFFILEDDYPAVKNAGLKSIELAKNSGVTPKEKEWLEADGAEWLATQKATED
ncbi:hypothetical protein OLZ31_26010, partial [Enterobacter asburiae]|nr:hypothetical protein [Enterobacter asburiae]